MWDPQYLTTQEASIASYGDSFIILYVGDVLSSTSGGRSVGIVRSRTKGHGVCFFFFVGDVRTSQETHLWASTACYWDTLLFYVYWNFSSPFKIKRYDTSKRRPTFNKLLPWPWARPSSSRNEYQEPSFGWVGRVESGRRVKLTTLQQSQNWLSKKCESVDVSQRNAVGLHGCLHN
jgi:hypothetical protein